MELLHKAWDFFAQHESVTGYSLLGLLTVGGEILFSLSAFQCPCGDRSFTYGLVYLLAPALALLFLGYILNGQTWKLFTGIWLNPRKVFPPEKRCHFFYILGKISLQVCIAPVMWMSVALLNGQFYVCAVSGSPASWRRAGLCAHVSGPCLEELPRVACNQTVLPPAQAEDIVRKLRAESQIIGWSFISSTMFISLLATCYGHCRSNMSHVQMKFWKIYQDEEVAQLDKKFKDYAARMSARNLAEFFKEEIPESFALPSFQDWEDASVVDSFSVSEEILSSLHKMVERDKKGSSPITGAAGNLTQAKQQPDPAQTLCQLEES